MPTLPPPPAAHTVSLLLRPMREADLTDERILRWHTDPEGYALMIEAPRSSDQARESLRAWYDGWRRDGLSYRIAEERDHPGRPVGIGGLRRLVHEDRGYANLYYRLAPEARGHGYALQIARAAVELALERMPQIPVVARIAPDNRPSLWTATRAGMIQLGPWRGPADPPDEPDQVLLQAPTVVIGGDADRDDLVDLWCRVNAAGGAVGWDGAAPRAEVKRELDRQLARAESTLMRLHAPTLDTFADRRTDVPRRHRPGRVLRRMRIHRDRAVARRTAPAQRGRGLRRHGPPTLIRAAKSVPVQTPQGGAR